MITLVTISKNNDLQYLIAYEEGLYRFKFIGSLTYTDSLAQIWNWEGIVSLAPEISGIRYGDLSLVRVASIADCKLYDGSFYYSGGDLYVHWSDDQGDWLIDRTILTLQVADIAVSDSFSNVTNNIFNGLFYKPSLESLSGIKLSADPLKLGLLGSQDMAIEINNGSGTYDFIDDKIARGSVVNVSIIDENETNIENAIRVFSGYSSGLQVTSKSLKINAIEQRFFTDAIVCKNTFKVADYANLDDDLIGARKPVALGDIRRGICVPVNSKGVDRSDSTSLTFLVSDPSLGAVRAISKFYDSNGSEITGFSTNLTNCTITWTKPANIDVDLKKFRWEGQGHNLGFGTYNNGVDIMRYAFNTFADVANVSTAFDFQAWLDVSANNPQAVGLSIQSERGMTQEILEPICTSLQVLVLTRGLGQITIIERDITADPIQNFDTRLFQSEYSINYDTKFFTNSLKIEYSPDFTNKDFTKSYNNLDYYDDIIKDYGNVTTSSISPIKTVLFSEADAVALSNEVMATSKRPDKIVSFEVAGYYDIKPFDIISVDVKRDPNANEPETKKYCEVLSYEYLPAKQNSKIQCRFVSNPVYLVDENGLYLLTLGNDYLVGSDTVEA